MRNSNPIKCDNTQSYDDFNKKVGKCVVDNFIEVYSPYIKKLLKKNYIIL